MSKQRIALLLLAVALLTIGLAREEDWAVFQKGAILCLECIGLG